MVFVCPTFCLFDHLSFLYFFSLVSWNFFLAPCSRFISVAMIKKKNPDKKKLRGARGFFPFTITHYNLSQWVLGDRLFKQPVTSHLHSGRREVNAYTLLCSLALCSGSPLLESSGNPCLGNRTAHGVLVFPTSVNQITQIPHGCAHKPNECRQFLTEILFRGDSRLSQKDNVNKHRSLESLYLGDFTHIQGCQFLLSYKQLS